MLTEFINNYLLAELDRLPGSTAALGGPLRYVLFPGGKRIRPVFMLKIAEDLEGSQGVLFDKVTTAGCAIEILHTASLIHDDLPSLDNDDMRRGKKSCHREYDEATAVLVGDFLTAWAFRFADFWRR